MKKNTVKAWLLALALPGAWSPAHANVGRTPATFHVDRYGAATYTVPIWAPRGPNGLEPQIALTYDSQGGSGYMGVGWSVSGISSIYRCNRTTAQDGTPAPVALTSSDAFCLDGERLQLTGGSYGVAGSTYQTEIATFEQVTAYGTAGNGPAYFVVQAPNGTQYEYGNGGGSEVLASGTSTAMQWYLDKVTDRAGNTMTFAYTDSTGSAVPSTISWTPTSHGATSYAYSMQFAYGTNASASSTYGYVAGTTVTNTNLLSSITVNYQGATVKKYALTYQSSTTSGRDELTQVKECADAAETNCLSPTTFSYQTSSAGVETSATAATASAPVNLVWNYDFNGDGRDDLAYCTAAPSLTVEVAFASSSGYGTPINTGIPCETSGVDTALFGDVLGDHRDGILAVHSGTWYDYQWNGSSFVGQSTGLAFQSAVQYVLADVTGDGRPDLISLNYIGSSLPTGMTIDVRLNTSSGSTASFSSTNALWYSLSLPSNLAAIWANIQSTSDGQNQSLGSGALRHLDFNGDGRDDLAFEYQTMICIYIRNVCHDEYQDHADELISTGSGFSTTQMATASTMTFPGVEFLNFNSDACTDYLYNSIIYVSGCNGTLPATVTVPSSSVVGAMDWNADGRTDILVNNGGTIGVYVSTGTGLTGLVSTAIPYNANDVYFAFDPNGNGLDSLGASNGSSVSYYAHNGAADLLASVTDGYGNTIKPTYVTLAQGSGSTYTPTNDAQFPYENYTGSLYVVNQVTYSDPSNPPNATYQRTHYYSGAWMNLQGRGFAGFETASVYDSRNQLYTRRAFDLTFPYTGMLSSEAVTENSAGGQVVSSISNTLADTTLSSTSGRQRYFLYVSASARKQYAVGGSDNGALVTSTSRSYSYDSYGNPTSISSTVTDEDGGSPDYGDSWTTSVTDTPDVNAGTWCLRLISQSVVSYSASNGSTPVSQTREYTPDTSNCRYTQIVTDPSSSSYAVTETLGYDSFGNIDSDTVTGAGMAARTTAASWGTTGQFPMSVTDPTGASTKFNYDFAYGLVSSDTDPNGLTTTWQYNDGFGRVTRETRPDGTYTTWSYSPYSGSDPKPRMVVTEQPHDTQGNVISTTSEYLDRTDRPYITDKTLLDGTAATVMQRTYDALGRVVSSQEPYEGSTVGALTYSYDLLGRVVEVQRPISATDSSPETWTYQYDGLTEVITDPNGHTRALARDPAGWLRRSTDDLGYAIDFGYDAAGDRDQVTDSQGNTLWTGSYAYGIKPFLTGETSMDRGAWGYTVDALGERTNWTDAKGQHFSETYDALSRPLTRSEPDFFTQWTWGSSAANHNVGRLASVCTNTGTNPTACSSTGGESESWTYDGDGRLSQRAITLPSEGTFTYTWQYNAATGFLQSLTYPTGSSGQALTLQYAYAYGYLQSITDTLDSPNIVVWKADTMNPAGQVTQDTLGNGIITTRAFDAVTHFLTSVQSGEGGGTGVQNMSFLYDPAGNVTQRQNNSLGLTEDFYYDGDNRLSYSTLNGTQNLSLTYDVMGNITNRSDVASNGTWTYDPNHKHQVTEAGSTAYKYTYDANGNMASRAGGAISWTSYNYPSIINDSATGMTIDLYYGPGRKVWLETTQSPPQGWVPGQTTETYRIGDLMDIVSNGGGISDRDYIFSGSQPVAVDARTQTSNTFYYFQSDQQGSIASVTNASGQVAVNESFTAYGARRNPATWSGAPSSTDLSTIAGITQHGYTFQRVLGEQIALNDMVGRVEDAIIGRFLSADPTVPNATDPQDWNDYSYTENNPLTYVDPTGFKDKKKGITASGGAGVIAGGAAGNGGAGGSGSSSTPMSVPALSEVDISGYSGNLASDISMSILAGSGNGYAIDETNGGLAYSWGSRSAGTPQSNPPKKTPCDQSAGAANNTGNHLSTGVSASGSTVNPLTSGGGGVWGRNWQSIPGGTSTLNTYNFSGNGLGLDVGGSIQSVWAWGNGSWTGAFHSVNFSVGLFSGSVFWTPGKGGYTGFSFGLGLGLPIPQGAYEETNYTCKAP